MSVIPSGLHKGAVGRHEALGHQGLPQCSLAIFCDAKGSKKRYSPLSELAQKSRVKAASALLAGQARSSTPACYRPDLDQHQHGPTARMGVKRRAGAELHARWPLADADFPRRLALRPPHRALPVWRPDQRRMLPRLCSAGSRFSAPVKQRIMDNLVSHKSAALRSLINAAGVRLWFLPPYSPGPSSAILGWSIEIQNYRSHSARCNQKVGACDHRLSTPRGLLVGDLL